MDKIFLYLLNRKPSLEETIKFKYLSQSKLNHIIIRSVEYSKFLEREKQQILLFITNKISISLHNISTETTDVIFQKILELKRKNNFSNQPILNLLESVDNNLKLKLKIKLGKFTNNIFQYYLYLGEIKFQYLENKLVHNLENLENLEKCYQTLIWDDRFIDFVEKNIHKSI